jgi:hypothetical protein
MTAKETFLQGNDDVKFLLGVVSSPMFDRAAIYAKQAWLERSDRETDPIRAVNQFLDVLRDLPVDPPKATDYPAPALHHDLDIRPRQSKTKKKETPQ